MTPILSMKDFAWRVGVPLERLEAIAEEIALDPMSHYRLQVLKKGDKVRHLRVPKAELKAVLRRIKDRILDPLPLSDAVHGGVRGRSPGTNARRHLAKRSVVTVDVKQFFPQVRHTVVYRMFRREFGFGRDVASLLTRLTTFRAELPQGSPTSTSVANLLLSKPLDKPTEAGAAGRGVEYTRFVDDAAMSGEDPRPLISAVAKRLSTRGLRVHRPNLKNPEKSKLRLMPSTGPQKVTGLNVNAPGGPSVPREIRDKVRAAIHQVPALAEADLPKAARSLHGRIAHIAQFNPGAAARLRTSLEQALAGRT